MAPVSNMMAYTTVDDNVIITTSIGLVENSGDNDGVYLLKTINTKTSPKTYDEMVKCTAATVDALRGQYDKIENDARSASPRHDAWSTWVKLASCLTYAPGNRHILYKINPLNGLPSFVYCKVPYVGDHNVDCYGDSDVCDKIFETIKSNQWNNTRSSPYHAFSQYGEMLHTALEQKVISGVDTPIVANQHMKITDSPELQWINVAMHMINGKTTLKYTGPQNTHKQYTDIMEKLRKSKDFEWSSKFATQIMAPYPVQWSTSDAALSQAMEIAAMKLVGHENYKRYLGAPGSAMNVTMGAAYFVIKPQLHQMHLKAMYTQDDKVMPMADGNATYVRDITPTGVRNRYLQALMVLGVG